MNGEARKPFSMKYINKELSFVSFSQKSRKFSDTVVFFILLFQSTFGLLKHNDGNTSALKFLKVFMGITF